jgi:hypothetical protein
MRDEFLYVVLKAAAVIVLIAVCWSLLGTLLALPLGHVLILCAAVYVAHSIGRKQGRMEVQEESKRRVKARQKLRVVKG